jgi:DUF1680 family protein
MGKAWVLAGLLLGAGGGDGLPRLEPVPASRVRLADPLWAPRIETNRTAALPFKLKSFVENGNLDNFLKAAGKMPGDHRGFLWADSDVYKTLEGAARAIAHTPDPALEKILEDAVARIGAALRPDGYLHTYLQLAAQKRLDHGRVETKVPWQDLEGMHEDYCMGHLIEAALAHHEATGRDDFLKIARAVADHLAATFGPEKRSGVPGHQEVELALLKLGRPADVALARFYLEERGRQSRGRRLYGEFCQDLKPLREQTEPLGHAVRAQYMYAAAVDLAARDGDRALLAAQQALWAAVVERKMYVTGGMGHTLYNEGFSVDYDLSNEHGYNETCASAAFILWSHRLAHATGDGRYVDGLERALYNTFLAGRSIDGLRMYYNNPTSRRARGGRFGIDCCATNMVRLVPSVPGWQYAVKPGEGVWVHLYAAGTAELPMGRIVQETAYPWDGAVRLTLTPNATSDFSLNLRIPAWAAGAAARVNGKDVDVRPVRGYLPLRRTWAAGDVVELTLPMPVRRVRDVPEVWANRGRVALMRGPLVYCLEEVDHAVPVHRIVLPAASEVAAEPRPGLLGGATVLRAKGVDAETGAAVEVTAVPYGLWDNRPLRPRKGVYDWSSDGLMTVWLPETAAAAQTPPDRGRLATARVTASHVFPSDRLEAVNDGILPKAADDASVPRFTWWDRKGTEEWIEIAFPEPQRVWRSDLFWYADAGKGGGCDFPRALRHEYWDGAAWKPVRLDARYEEAIDFYAAYHFSIVRFEPVTTTRIRAVVRLKDGRSAGLLEWRLP